MFISSMLLLFLVIYIYIFPPGFWLLPKNNAHRALLPLLDWLSPSANIDKAQHNVQYGTWAVDKLPPVYI